MQPKYAYLFETVIWLKFPMKFNYMYGTSFNGYQIESTISKWYILQHMTLPQSTIIIYLSCKYMVYMVYIASIAYFGPVRIPTAMQRVMDHLLPLSYRCHQSFKQSVTVDNSSNIIMLHERRYWKCYMRCHWWSGMLWIKTFCVGNETEITSPSFGVNNLRL